MIFLEQDCIWIFIFEKNWIKTGSGYLFDFHYEIFLRVIQDDTNDGVDVFFAMIFTFTKNQIDFVSMYCTNYTGNRIFGDLKFVTDLRGAESKYRIRFCPSGQD